MRTPRSFRELVDSYTGAGWFPYIFGAAMLFALLVSGISVILVFTRPVELEPWGRYSTPVYVGTVEDMGGDTLPVVVRDLTGDGLPVVTEPTFPVSFIRCGPSETVEVVSQRNWTIRNPDGEVMFSTQGRRVPLTLTAPNTESGCDVITTEITLDDNVLERLRQDFTIRLRADLEDVTGQFRTVIATSERFYYDPTIDPEEVTVGRVTIEVP